MNKYLRKWIDETNPLMADNIEDFANWMEKKFQINDLPNREFKGIIKTYSGFTHSNRNILQIEVSGVENYIANNLKVGDEIKIQHG